jgi:hypothetical protein
MHHRPSLLYNQLFTLSIGKRYFFRKNFIF